MMMAGLDGIQNKIDPGDPLDKDIYALSPEELRDVPRMPASLEEALDHLEKDYEFLLKGDVFTRDAIEMWLDYKREREVQLMRLHPTPLEFLHFRGDMGPGALSAQTPRESGKVARGLETREKAWYVRGSSCPRTCPKRRSRSR
jgi:hypothetical protein